MPSHNSTPPQNPYQSAAATYGDHSQKHTPDQRELEARVLIKSANMMQELQQHWDPDNIEKINEILTFNRQIWMLFFDTALENKDGNRPNDLRSNIVNLASFIFKRTVEILSDPAPGKFDILISINRDIAAGLMVQQAGSGAQSAPPPPQGSTSSTTITSA
jgi:flagellar protein FlaF